MLETPDQWQNKKDFLSDIAKGVPDGITVPFVLAVGLSAVTANTSMIFISGLAVIATGAFTMGLGAYFTTKTERAHFNTDVKIKDLKERKFLSDLDIQEDVQNIASKEILKENDMWSDLLKQRQGSGKANKNGFTIAIAYIMGGLIPLLPFFVYTEVWHAIRVSLVFTFISLFISGFVKSRINRINPWTGSLRILVFSALAAGAAYGVANLINN